MQAGDDGPIKIGLASDVERRRKSLQTAHHAALFVLCAIPGDRLAERRILERFRPIRFRGEWHRPTVGARDPPGSTVLRSRHTDSHQIMRWADDLPGLVEAL
jgi:hypothetical protein